ncbi:hypothetical protein BDQ17DRAFT_1260967 [Cyathus striatus]|nr:hypothetical protein BDQ17DRAFT_1260967 [Cyathus striatus]
MNYTSNSFTIPLTFPGIASLRTDSGDVSDARNIMERSIVNTRATVLKYWEGPHVHDGPAQDTSSSGAIVGCDDGTLYVFHRSCQPTIAIEAQSSPVNSQPQSRPKSPLRVPRGSSRSTSPSTSSFNLSATPFTVTPRSRVVSGISREQVEAPKNYVDFEDEPEKLKDMLKGRSPRPSSDTSSERRASLSKSTVSPVPGNSVLKRKETPKSMLSATNSRAPTPKSFSTSSSPKDGSFVHEHLHELTLRYHTIPSTCSPERAVTDIQFLNGHRFFAALQQTGDLYVFSSQDGCCVASVNVEVADFPPPGKEKERGSNSWNWTSLTISNIDESIILLVSATNYFDLSAVDEELSSEKSLSVMIKVIMGGEAGPSEIKLIKMNRWHLDGSPKANAIHHRDERTSSLFCINNEGHLLVRDIHVQPPPLPTHSMMTEHESHISILPSSLPIPNVFKSSKSMSGESTPLLEDQQEDKPSLITDEVHDVGEVLSSSSSRGFVTHSVSGKVLGIVWCSNEVSVFEYDHGNLSTLFRGEAVGVVNAKWMHHDTYAIVYDVRFYKSTDPSLVSCPLTIQDLNHSPQLIQTVVVSPHEVHAFSHPFEFVTARIAKDGRRQLTAYCIGTESVTFLETVEPSRSLWQSNSSAATASTKIQLTSLVALEADDIVQGYSDGHVRQFTLAQMCRNSSVILPFASSSKKTSDAPLPGYIIGLHVVHNQRTKEKYLVGGADDGSVAFWQANTLELCARWTLFIAPLSKVVQFAEDETTHLRGCVLCISQDGTIAVIAVDGFQFLYLIPGSISPVDRVCLGGDNLLVVYADGKTRLWDIRTKEFWRSMGSDKAEEMLLQGGWIDLSTDTDICIPNTIWKPLLGAGRAHDFVCTLSLDIEQLVTKSIALAKSLSTSKEQTRVILHSLERMQILLSTLLTLGLSEDVDSICHGKLGVYPSSVTVGLSSPTFTAISLFSVSRPFELWCISGSVTAARLVAIIMILRVMSLFEYLVEAANTVIAFYTTSLSLCCGPLYQAPSLSYLAGQWFAASNETRYAIRMVFDATVARMTDEEASGVTEKWRHHLPCLQPEAERESATAAHALFICGYVASDKYSLLSTNALTDISKSITLYLHDDSSVYRGLAVDLCSRGFHVWQHYIDAMDILRSLFALATGPRKETISVQNVAAHARLAVLSIATNNTPLFMTTLCLDILSPQSLDHRKSVMQIVAFLIRKRPLVLQPNLPRLTEAVVKSLDPNSTANRDAVLDTATEIIGYVVKTFPSVDFHMVTQRLAVGTYEGAVIMYDLKTAIRLYVLESHKKPITACSFSPDGRRLVTVSLEESVALVWKVGSSIVSFFNPGAPPRQGHGGSEPFKTFPFRLGSDDMSIAETFDQIHFDWIANRNVKLKIRETILGIST